MGWPAAACRRRICCCPPSLMGMTAFHEHHPKELQSQSRVRLFVTSSALVQALMRRQLQCVGSLCYSTAGSGSIFPAYHLELNCRILNCCLCVSAMLCAIGDYPYTHAKCRAVPGRDRQLLGNFDRSAVCRIDFDHSSVERHTAEAQTLRKRSRNMLAESSGSKWDRGVTVGTPAR